MSDFPVGPIEMKAQVHAEQELVEITTRERLSLHDERSTWIPFALMERLYLGVLAARIEKANAQASGVILGPKM